VATAPADVEGSCDTCPKRRTRPTARDHHPRLPHTRGRPRGTDRTRHPGRQGSDPCAQARTRHAGGAAIQDAAILRAAAIQVAAIPRAAAIQVAANPASSSHTGRGKSRERQRYRWRRSCDQRPPEAASARAPSAVTVRRLQCHLHRCPSLAARPPLAQGSDPWRPGCQVSSVPLGLPRVCGNRGWWSRAARRVRSLPAGIARPLDVSWRGCHTAFGCA
jgi:hypothetical protein